MLLSMLWRTLCWDREDGSGAVGAKNDAVEMTPYEVGDDGVAAPQGEPHEDPRAGDAEEEAAEVRGSQEARPSRTARRQSRYQEQVARAERAEKQIEEVVRRQHDLEVSLARAEGALRERPRFGEVPTSEHDRLMENIEQRRRALQLEYDSLSEDQQRARFDEYSRRQRDLDVEFVRAEAAQTVRQMQPSPEKLAEEARRQELLREHGDIFANKRASALARVKMMQRVEVNGEAHTRDMEREVFDEVRAELGMAPRGSARPTQGQRVATSGMRGNGAPMASEGRTVQVPWSPETESMARAAYPNIKDPVELRKRWSANYAKQSAKQSMRTG